MDRMNRREFLTNGSRLLVGTGLGLCGLSGCATLTGVGSTPEIRPEAYSFGEDRNLTILLSDVPELAEVGGSVKILDERLPDPLIVARVREGGYVTASIRCTHRGVEVEYRPERAQFQCASLGSTTYALDGSRVSGFGKKPLTVYPTVLSESPEATLTIQITE